MAIAESGYRIIQKVAEREVKKLHLLEYGRVEAVNIHRTELDAINYSCAILLISRTTENGKPLKLENVPIATLTTGEIFVPYIDDMVLVCYINGDFEMPVIIGKIYSSAKRPPLYAEGDYRITFDPKRYQPKARQPVNRRIIEFLGLNDKNEYRIEFRNGPVIDYTPKHIQLAAGKAIVTLNQNGEIEIATKKAVKIRTASDVQIKCKNLKIETKSDAKIKCRDCKLEASGNIELGSNGAGVVTEMTHKCYFTGAPPVGSKTVKAKS